MISKAKFLFFSLVFLPTVANAAVPSISKLTKDVAQATNEDAYRPRGVWPFLSTGMGIYDYTEELTAKDGQHMNLKFVGSYYSDHDWNYDLGLGLQGNSLGRNNVSAGILEIGARYKLMNRWSVGPVSHIYIGNGEDFGSRWDSMTGFIGATILKDVPLNDTVLLRAGGKMMTDFTIPDSYANVFMLELQIGFPVREKTSVAEAGRVPEKSTSIVENVSTGDITLEENAPEYEQAKIQPTEESQKYIENLAKQLSKYPNMYQKIIIKGHSDAKGSGKINQTLSESRANDIAKRLSVAGIPSHKIEALGFGEDSPKYLEKNETAFSKNRRVEIEIIGVKNPKGFEKLLNEITEE